MKCLWKALRNGVCCQGNYRAIRELGLSAPPLPQHPISMEGEELKVEVIVSGERYNQSCIHNETSIKTPKDGAGRTSDLVNTWRC